MSELSDISDRLNAAADRAESASQIIHDVANGDENTKVLTENGAVDSLARLQKKIESQLLDFASVTPEQDKIPKADSSGHIDLGWLPTDPEQTKKLANYSALRSYTGPASMVEITQSDISGKYKNIGVVGGYTDFGGDYVIGSDGRVWARMIDEIVMARWFGEPSSASMQAIFNAGAGKTVVFDGSKTYPWQSFEIKPNTKVKTHGATFARETASVTVGVTVNSCIEIDVLKLKSPGGAGGDKLVLLKGDIIDIGHLEGVADAEGSFTSANWMVEATSKQSNVMLRDIHIGRLESKNYRTAFFGTYIDGLRLDSIDVEKYRLAVYLKDVRNSHFPHADIRGKSATLTGDPGENGLLLESTLAKYSMRNLHFSNWIVEDSGEHCYRLGGNLAMRDIFFEDCVAKRPGQAWTVGYPLAVDWHGGSGFKALGGTAMLGQRHKNIRFTRCSAYDCSMNYGTFPSGHGVNNFTPFLLSCLEDVHLTDCTADAQDQEFCARNAFLISACDGVYLTANNFLKAQISALNPYEENTLVSQGYAGLALGVSNLYVVGGVYEVSNKVANSGIPIYALGTAYVNKNWSLRGVNLRGGSRAIYVNNTTTGSYNTGIVEFDFAYSESNSDNATYTMPIVDGAAVGLLSCRGPWRPSAYSPSSLNGSIWQDTLAGNFRRKASNSWAVI